jgi:uncharacterized protein YceH (UPF0502 family)
MTLTQHDLQAIGRVVSTTIEQQVRPLVKEEIRAALTEQNQFLAHSFADLKAIMEHSYVSREEFEQVKEDLQTEVDDLRKELQQLKHKLAST